MFTRTNGSSVNRRASFKLVLALVAVHLLAAVGLAQIIGNVPKNFILDGAIDEWDKNAPSFGRHEAGLHRPI
jgi:hypothetical protein